ncbi:unnamed protein product [Pleuronectes platessa]|uniref:Uncharacterized protein n=1 Tax=Pleuronectes platessa TaxID=8262 RepID=A0A9N7VHB6_PLEPL|nr:unnamed protein product [Pleuronectes platessa]
MKPALKFPSKIKHGDSISSGADHPCRRDEAEFRCKSKRSCPIRPSANLRWKHETHRSPLKRPGLHSSVFQELAVRARILSQRQIYYYYCTTPPYQFPIQPVPAFHTGDGHRPAAQEKERPRTSEDHFEASRTSSLRRRGEEGDGATAPPAAARAQRFNHKYQ